MDFEQVSVTDPRAQTLLAEYFADRATSFPVAQGTYRVTSPDPASFRAPSGVFLLVLRDGVAVGCGGLRSLSQLHEHAPNAPRRFEVKHLWVQPQLRGTGSGRALLAELEKGAGPLGADEIVLDTNSSLIAAAHLYAAAGYRPILPYNNNPNADTWLGKRLKQRD